MSEVDDNLNYMLGQLSLVVSEFNQVTTLTLTIIMTTLTLTTLALTIILTNLTLTLFYGPHSGEDRAGGGDGGHRRGSAGGVQEGRGRQEIKHMGICDLRHLRVIGLIIIFYLLHIYKIRAFLLINQIFCRKNIDIILSNDYLCIIIICSTLYFLYGHGPLMNTHHAGVAFEICIYYIYLHTSFLNSFNFRKETIFG